MFKEKCAAGKFFLQMLKIVQKQDGIIQLKRNCAAGKKFDFFSSNRITTLSGKSQLNFPDICQNQKVN